jgi:hypothetical protein
MKRHIAAFALAACTSSEPPLPDRPVFTGEELSVTWGAREVAPGEEGTRCAVVDVGNAAEVKISKIHNVSTSHHLVVYLLDDPTTPVSEPTICEPFAKALAPGAGATPLMVAQKPDDALELPGGVAYTFYPHQKILLELHYFNSTDAPQMATATTTFHVGAPDVIRHEASFLFIGTPDLELPPGVESTVEAYFTPPESLEGIEYYAITGHTHGLGTDVQVQTAPARDGARTAVYAPAAFLWSEPETRQHRPPFTVPDGGGFHFACKYRNTTPETVTWGESATAEMCFFWAYYYPSRGARMCVHSTLVGGPEGIDVCCPAETGDTLAAFVCSEIAKG